MRALAIAAVLAACCRRLARRARPSARTPPPRRCPAPSARSRRASTTSPPRARDDRAHRPQRLGGPARRAARATRRGVPGLQIDGYFPDTSTSNTTHGWNHDSQFVIRLPDDWNGKLVITGAPGVRKQYANDFVISATGCSRAATPTRRPTRATPAPSFYERRRAARRRDRRVEPARHRARGRRQGGRRASATAAPPARTYVTGISNGGYLTRWQLENRPDLYDGGVDWEGTLLDAGGAEPAHLPAAGAEATTRATARPATRRRTTRCIAAGFAPGSEFLWDDHYAVYWDLTQRTYREELDPDYDGATEAGTPFCQSGTPSCDADYDYALAPAGACRPRSSKVANTGEIGKPLLTLHGTLDTLLPIRVDSDVYARMVAAAGARRAAPLLRDRGRQPRRRPLRRASPTGCGRCCRATARRSSRSSAGSSRAPRRRDSQFVPNAAAATSSTRATCARGRDRRRRPDRSRRSGAPPARAPARDASRRGATGGGRSGYRDARPAAAPGGRRTPRPAAAAS